MANDEARQLTRGAVLGLKMVLLLSMAFLPILAQAGLALPSGVVVAAQGEVAIERAADRLPARVGLAVEVGDVLVTGPKGRLKVLLTDDSVLALGGQSRLRVGRHLFEPGRARETNLELLGGRVRALVQQVVGGSQARFQVSTGTAVAGVRGTEFLVDRGDGEGATDRVVVFSGAVAWAGGEGQELLVQAGEASALEGGRLGRPEALAAAELTRLRRDTDSDAGPEALAWGLAPAERLGRTGPARAAEERGQDRRDVQRGDDYGGPIGIDPPPDTTTRGGDGADWLGEGGVITGLGQGDRELLDGWRGSYRLDPPLPGGGSPNFSLTVRLKQSGR
jgi:hypothetical protein